ncbi:MAG: beta-N-acetylhexosaminidase [Hyphomicrobiaceae bacterium]
MGEEQLNAADAAHGEAASPSGRRACIVGLGGQTLSSEEADFLEACRPCGLIVFSRNFAHSDQLRGLISDACKAAGGEQLLVLVDQEGGRVQRMRGAGWPDLPPAAAFGALFAQNPQVGLEAAELCSRWLAGLLRDVGINANCVPCLDVPVPGADGIIGDRAYGNDPALVAAVGGAVASGAIDGGVVPVMKHIPGHGRAGVDSHHALPVVDSDLETLVAQDFAPFADNNGLPAAMTAHVTFSNIDALQPASISHRLTNDIIRGRIGFQGLLMSDDISMQALAGSIAERGRRVIEAGSDVILHCNGVMDEMREMASVAPVLANESLVRYRRCLEIAAQAPGAVDEATAVAAMERARTALSARETAS